MYIASRTFIVINLKKINFWIKNWYQGKKRLFNQFKCVENELKRNETCLKPVKTLKGAVLNKTELFKHDASAKKLHENKIFRRIKSRGKKE